jgi:hypothetical protein
MTKTNPAINPDKSGLKAVAGQNKETPCIAGG